MSEIKLADGVWIATALLHRERPGVADFSVKQIERRLMREGLTAETASSVASYIAVHCVGNRAPGYRRYRMLFETAPSRRRLFRPGDPYHPKRQGGAMVPRRGRIPPKYRSLLEWYERTWAAAWFDDPLIALASRHRDLWKTVEPDDYVRQLREGFNTR